MSEPTAGCKPPPNGDDLHGSKGLPGIVKSISGGFAEIAAKAPGHSGIIITCFFAIVLIVVFSLVFIASGRCPPWIMAIVILGMVLIFLIAWVSTVRVLGLATLSSKEAATRVSALQEELEAANDEVTELKGKLLREQNQQRDVFWQFDSLICTVISDLPPDVCNNLAQTMQITYDLAIQRSMGDSESLRVFELIIKQLRNRASQ